jgi:hypothetical protein
MNSTELQRALDVAADFEFQPGEIEISEGDLPSFISARVRLGSNPIKVEVSSSRKRGYELEENLAHEFGHIKFKENHRKIFYLIQAVNLPITIGLNMKWYLSTPFMAGLLYLGMAVSPQLTAAYVASATGLHFLGEIGANKEAKNRGYNLGWNYVL